MELIYTIFALLVAFQVKHFVVDFVIQMYRKDSLAKFNKTGWARPLAKHAMDHGIATAIIAIITFVYFDIGPAAILWTLGLFMFDAIIHFSMDRFKASPNLLGKYCHDMAKRPFWMCLGFDQAVHHLTHYAIIGIIAAVII